MTIDTNIVIAYLGGDRSVVSALSLWQKEGRIFLLSTVAETEILSFLGFTPHELRETEKFIEENFASIHFDRRIARIAASIRREAKIKFPDAAIAATALYTRTPLVTRNVRDFRKVPSLNILTI